MRTEQAYWSHDCWASGFDGESRVDGITVDPCPDCGVTQEQAASEDGRPTDRPTWPWIVLALIFAAWFGLFAFFHPWFGAVVAAPLGFVVIVGRPTDWRKRG